MKRREVPGLIVLDPCLALPACELIPRCPIPLEAPPALPPDALPPPFLLTRIREIDWCPSLEPFPGSEDRVRADLLSSNDVISDDECNKLMI